MKPTTTKTISSKKKTSVNPSNWDKFTVRMLSKMMQRDDADRIIELENIKRMKSITTTTTPTALKENTIDTEQTDKEIKKPKQKNSLVVSSNWDKFQSEIKQSAQPEKLTSKRPFSKSETTQNGKRKVRNQKTKIPAKVNKMMAEMDIENTELTKQVAIDCEMVGIGDGTESMIARVSIVNRHGACVYDKYVKPREIVKDYRTPVSGIRPHHLRDGENFMTVQSEVAEILKGRILVGHALKNDLSVLFLSHPKRNLRDTSRYTLFRKVSKGNTPSLKKLASELLGVDIQTGEHNSIEDARTAMQLYVLYKKHWESDIHKK